MAENKEAGAGAALTGGQKRQLRGLGHALEVALNVGKAGLTDGVSAALKELFAHHELVKIRLPAGDPAERAALAEELASKAGAAVAGAVGRTALLYKPDAELPAGERIALRAK